MVDATGKRSNEVGLKINKYDALSYSATLIPDSNWLKTAVYPVLITRQFLIAKDQILLVVALTELQIAQALFF